MSPALVRDPARAGTASEPQDFVYGRTALVTDPFGTPFTIGSRPRRE